MFKVEHISKSYGKKQVLSDVSLSANNGETIGILGVNGSGKSTLLNEIAKIYAGNKDVALGYLPQENPLFDELKPVDNIRLWTSLSKQEILERLNESPLMEMGISSFLDTRVGNMSGGMKKRVSLASVLINNPDVFLLDEPFAALDLLAKKDILYFIQAFSRRGGINIIASHEEEIFNICNKVYLIKNGKLYDTEKLKADRISYMDMLRS